MKQTKIHLSEPFKEVLASLLTLPSTHAETDATDSILRKSARCGAEVKEALRSLYEAAHGRQVETQIGFIAIAPPVASFLKDEPYYVATQYEFFLEAFTRILAAGSPPREDRVNGAQPGSKRVVSRREAHSPELTQKRGNGNVPFRRTVPRNSNNPQMTHL